MDLSDQTRRQGLESHLSKRFKTKRGGVSQSQTPPNRSGTSVQ